MTDLSSFQSRKNDLEKKNRIWLRLRQYKLHLSNECSENSPMLKFCLWFLFLDKNILLKKNFSWITTFEQSHCKWAWKKSKAWKPWKQKIYKGKFHLYDFFSEVWKIWRIFKTLLLFKPNVLSHVNWGWF